MARTAQKGSGTTNGRKMAPYPSRTAEIAQAGSWWLGKANREDFGKALDAELPRITSSKFHKLLLPTWIQD